VIRCDHHHIRLVVHALADAGGLLDCTSLACAAALHHFRRPDVEVIGEGQVTVHAPDLCAPVPLAMHHTPFCISFAFYKPAAAAGEKGRGHQQQHVGGEEVEVEVEGTPRVLMDPAGLEQALAHGVLVLALTPQRELAVVHKAGGLPLAPETLMGAVQVAARRARELESWLDVRVCDDWIRNKVEVR
jgi:exosome complex component RRP45